MKIENFLIGSDYEMSLINKNGQPISAVGKLPGSKEDPADIGEFCGLQVDNVNMEGTIPPVDNRDDFLKFIKYGIETTNKHYLEEQDLELCASSSQIYTDEELDSDTARLFGCDISYNCYTQKAMKKPSAKNKNMRTCGFHIHVGFPYSDELNGDEIFKFIQYMDLYLGVPSILIDPDTRRRELYGKAGDCRIKPRDNDGITYIVPEYRSLGGNLLSSDEQILWAYDQTIIAIDKFNQEIELPDGELVQNIINNSLIEEAKVLVEKYNISLPQKVLQYV